MREFISTYPQRGLLIVISDFLDDDGCEKALQYLADFGHELLLIQVWSDEDRVPPWNGELELVDAESGSHVKMQVDERARERYTAAFDQYAETLAEDRRAATAARYVGVADHAWRYRRRDLRSAWCARKEWSEAGRCVLPQPHLRSSSPPCSVRCPAVVVALYLLDRSRRKQTVATLRFWVAAEQPTVVARRKRIQQPLSLLLQLISICLLLLAIAQLRLGSPGATPFDHVLILETSAWMGARAPRAGKPRPMTLMDEARRRARAYLRVAAGAAIA